MVVFPAPEHPVIWTAVRFRLDLSAGRLGPGPGRLRPGPGRLRRELGPGRPAQPTTPASPAVTPSASVKKLQQELGQLNYYEGPVDGIMGTQTAAVIMDLQRQAGLPQTGTMNAATPGRPGQLPGPRQQPDGRLTAPPPPRTTRWP